MCGGSRAPQDNSVALARIEAQEARRAREEQQQREERERSEFDQRLGAAFTNAITGANDFFASQGLDPSNFTSAITNEANRRRSSVPILDTSPQTYFDNIGQIVFDREQDALRSRSNRALDAFASEGFARSRINDTADDALLDAILADSRNDAETYLQRLLDRGVITNRGFEGGIDDLDDQNANARLLLNQIGAAELERGRGNLRDIAATGRERASTLNLGDIFDAETVRTDIDNSANDFFAQLADNLKGSTPDDLFDVSNLANIAGAAQGAQNTAFDANALLGIDDDDDGDEEDTENEDELFEAF